MTSQVLGLMINSANNGFDGINRDAHTLATDLILLDRLLPYTAPTQTRADGLRCMSSAHLMAPGQP
jgi:hypothetical protein